MISSSSSVRAKTNLVKNRKYNPYRVIYLICLAYIHIHILYVSNRFTHKYTFRCGFLRIYQRSTVAGRIIKL